MSTSSFDPDDPRLTAYALGEADEADRRAVEQILAGSAEARAEVEQTRALAQVLAEEYAQENEQYAAARPKIIVFPQVGRRRWPLAMPMLSAAAALALCASLAYLATRRAERPRSAPTVAASPSGAPDAPSSAAPEPVPTQPVEALAMNRRRDKDQEADRVTVAPQAMPAPAAAAPIAAATPEIPGAPYTVNIHTADDQFLAGVILSTNGLILASTSLPGQTMQGPCEVTLSDGRTFPAAPERSSLGPGWYWLRIKAAGLPAAALETQFPGSGASFVFASAGSQTGRSMLAFDAAGKLLVANSHDQEMATRGRMKTAAPRRAVMAPPVRPFTPAERKVIQQAVSEP